MSSRAEETSGGARGFDEIASRRLVTNVSLCRMSRLIQIKVVVRSGRFVIFVDLVQCRTGGSFRLGTWNWSNQ